MVMSNNPIDKYQYSYGSGLVNPLATTSSCVRDDYYVVCRRLSSVPTTPEVSDFLQVGDAEAVVLGTSCMRHCVWVLCWPDVELLFSDSGVQSLGINDYGAREYRWYWDSAHPDAFIGFQLVEESRVENDFVKFCLVLDVCERPALLSGGSLDITLSTGIEDFTFKVVIQADYFDA